MTIQQCKYVLEIAQQGSLSAAAKKLFIAQSSLSASLMSLEQELEITIFERSTSGMFLTCEGEEFVSYAKKLVSESEFVIDRYKGKKAIAQLHISTQHYDFVADVFSKAVAEITASSYSFSLKEKTTYDVICDVEKAYSDIGILAIRQSEKNIMTRYISGHGLNFFEILKTKPHIFIRKSHPLALRKKLSASELADYPYLSYEQGRHSNSFFAEELRMENVRKKITISDRASLMNVLLATDAFTVGTGIMPSELNRGSIISIPYESSDTYIIGYILRPDRRLSPSAENFIARLFDEIKK